MLIGLTGGLGCGKSAVCEILVSLGAKLIDCDVLAREAAAPGSEGLAAIAREFGDGVILPGGRLDRAGLAEIVFADEKRRRALEGILHPIIERMVLARAAEIHARSPDAIIIVDAPVLFEAGLHEKMDATVTVTCAPAIQMIRAEEKGLTAEQARARIAAQLPQDRKAALSDYALDNTSRPHVTERKARELMEAFRRRMARRAAAR